MKSLAQILPLLPALGLFACSPESPADREAESPASTATASPSASDTGAVPGRTFAYTRLSDCRTLREEKDEGQFIEQDCPGLGGYRLKATVGDLRAELHVVAGDERETGLDLTRIGGGGFSALGQTLEWRGPQAQPFAPDSLILRYDVVEKPDTTEDVSYLLVARLGPAPCVIGKVPPGPDQNAKARALADGTGVCIGG